MRRILVLLGPPGVGKGTVSRLLIEQFGFEWLSSGELLRDVKKLDSEIGQQIATLIDAGEFVSDELIISLVEKELEKVPKDCCLLLDGFPRTLPQAEALDVMSPRFDAETSLAIELQADSGELERRILNRAQEEGRRDDDLETFRHRIRVFQERTAPLISYYKTRGRLQTIDAMGTPQQVLERASLCIQKNLPSAGISSQKEAS